jgi:hypothetical protein
MPNEGSVTGSATPRVPVHRRTIEIEAYEDGEDLEVVGRIRDVRPWAEGLPYATLHDMTLTLRVDDDMVITEVSSSMAKHPHTECPRITGAFEQMVGLSVARGYNREIKARLGGIHGCAHMTQLALALGPAVIQCRVSRNGRRAAQKGDSSQGAGKFGRNSCHLWEEDGVIETKLGIGWRPGMFGDYPAKPLEELLPLFSRDH